MNFDKDSKSEKKIIYLSLFFFLGGGGVEEGINSVDWQFITARNYLQCITFLS